MSSPSKYTKEILEDAVRDSKNFFDVLRKIGASYNLRTHIANRVRLLGIDYSHFIVTNKGKEPAIKRSADEVLIKHNDPARHREKSSVLKRALLEKGIEEKCQSCGLDPIWNNKELVLHVDHINGECLDNTIDNLRLLCPNCHSQTETWGVRNK